MSITNANPSIDPANYGSITGAFRHIFLKLMQGIDGVSPAEVIAYNRNTKRAQVQPLINQFTTASESIPRAQIASVPVLQIGGGGFVIDFNLVSGDLGIILACDRDISLFLQQFKAATPNTFRVKDFSDSVFLPVQWRPYSIASEDATNIVIQSLNGTVKVSLGNNKIKIAAPTVEIDATTLDVTAPTINITAATGVNITTPTLAVTGNITATGDITPHV